MDRCCTNCCSSLNRPRQILQLLSQVKKKKKSHPVGFVFARGSAGPWVHMLFLGRPHREVAEKATLLTAHGVHILSRMNQPRWK